MESLSLTHSIRVPVCTCPSTQFGAQPRPHRLLVSSKKSDLQDFQGYAKPVRLFPATQVTVFTNSWPEPLAAFESQSLYRILLRTSPIYGSELTDMSSAILICIISKSGESILHRIPATSVQEHLPESEVVATQGLLHFSRNSSDEFIFQGPQLGDIQALWISVESGRWRLGGVNLTIINGCKFQSGKSVGNGSLYTSMEYDFETDDILLGEGGEISMIELRPCRITEYSGTDISQLLNNKITSSTFSGETVLTNEESMQEYADLKYSLLLYDAMLIFAGTSVASLTAGENSAVAFLTGGIGGFLYLLLLQRSVDGIQAPDATSQRKEEENDMSRVFGGVKGSLLIVAFAFGLSIVVGKHGYTEVEMVLLSPKEIVVGMIGFLACKLAVILAAFKPLSIGMKDVD